MSGGILSQQITQHQLCVISKPERNYIMPRNVLWHRVGALWHHFVCVQQFQHPMIFLFHTSRHRILHNCLTGRFVVVVLAAKLCLTLCNPMDCSPPDPSVHGISQAKLLESVTISSSRGSFLPKDWTHIYVSCISRWILTTLPPGPLCQWRSD